MSLLYLSICFNLLACSTKNNNAEVVSEDTTFVTEAENASIQSIPPVQWVLTAKEQANLSPEEVIKVLKEGNERFVSNDLTARDHSAQVRKSADAQFPKAIVLSCVDSRIPVEDVFDRGIGDIFVARVAGNFINDDILGSMEFACKVSGAKLIVVMGHENCGAIQAAIDGVKLGNITSMLKNIKPAIALTQYEGDRNSANPEFVHLVCENNVRNSMKEILKRSPILTEMVTLGEIKVVGAIYDMDSGQAAFLED
jgi:carbonic anhydrase